MLFFRHLGPLPVEDYDTDDYFNQDIYPLGTLFNKYAHKYAARLLSSAFSSSLIGKRLLAIQGSVSGSDYGVDEHRQPIIEKQPSNNPRVHSRPSSKKRCRCSSSSPPSLSATSGDFGIVTVVEKGESSPSGSMFKSKKARRSCREPPKKRLQIEEESCSDSKNEVRSSGGESKKSESAGSNETLQPVEPDLPGSKTEEEIEHNLNNKEPSSSSAGGIINSTHRSRSPKKAKDTKKQALKPKVKKTNKTSESSSTTWFPTWELQPKPTPADAAIPPEFRKVIDETGGVGTEVKFLLRKILRITDLLSSQNRLPFYFKQLSNQFLTPEEFREFEDKALVRNVSHAIQVKVIDTKGKIWHEFSLRRWPKYYAIITKWYELVQDNELKPYDRLSVWYFRVNGQLVFVLVKD